MAMAIARRPAAVGVLVLWVAVLGGEDPAATRAAVEAGRKEEEGARVDVGVADGWFLTFHSVVFFYLNS